MTDVWLEGTTEAANRAGISARTGIEPAPFPAPTDPDARPSPHPAGQADELDLARGGEYALLAALLLRSPDPDMLARLAGLKGDATPLGLAHIGLAQAAAGSTASELSRDYFDLFIGVGRGELLPFASYYMTGFLQDRPLVLLRDDLRRLGLERSEGRYEPEDHIATLCEIMSGFATGQFEAPRDEERQFFRRHLLPWAVRFFDDLQAARPEGFYGAVGRLGQVFFQVEAEAFRLES